MSRKFRHPYVAVVVTLLKDGEKTERYRSYERRVDAEDYCYRVNKNGPINETAHVVDAKTLTETT